MYGLSALILRLTVGGLLAGHGSQKLFGWYGGGGLEGTAGYMESLGMKPGYQWATLAGFSELVGGVLTALGFLHPVGPLLTVAPMATATMKAHAGKPIWVSAGGAELPVTNMAIAAALLLRGPGWLSIDGLLRTRAPFWMVTATLGAIGFGLYTMLPRNEQQQVLQTADRVRERVLQIAA